MKVYLCRCRWAAWTFGLTLVITGGLAVNRQGPATLAAGGLSLLFLLLWYRSRLDLARARLIWDNCLLRLPSGEAGSPGRETIVSTFGLMKEGRVYPWGQQGLEGDRLLAVAIYGDRLELTFGNGRESHFLKMLHGLKSSEDIFNLAEKLWRETGVRAVIQGWQNES